MKWWPTSHLLLLPQNREKTVLLVSSILFTGTVHLYEVDSTFFYRAIHTLNSDAGELLVSVLVRSLVIRTQVYRLLALVSKCFRWTNKKLGEDCGFPGVITRWCVAHWMYDISDVDWEPEIVAGVVLFFFVWYVRYTLWHLNYNLTSECISYRGRNLQVCWIVCDS
jgi:hypothetical protein